MQIAAVQCMDRHGAFAHSGLQTARSRIPAGLLPLKGLCHRCKALGWHRHALVRQARQLGDVLDQRGRRGLAAHLGPLRRRTLLLSPPMYQLQTLREHIAQVVATAAGTNNANLHAAGRGAGHICSIQAPTLSGASREAGLLRASADGARGATRHGPRTRRRQPTARAKRAGARREAATKKARFWRLRAFCRRAARARSNDSINTGAATEQARGAQGGCGRTAVPYPGPRPAPAAASCVPFRRFHCPSCWPFQVI